ncbi:ATP-binding protein [Tundrisphaera lichenicola]|uniref:ATP-binding protein n=1 Tax=Tundrisphaera lichenicola TaxID=2029860 RepID=UPI003EB83603
MLIHCRPADVEGQAGLQIAVSDNGPGLNPREVANVFEPFYTTKIKGIGLGLAFARRIVEAHGGRIEIFVPDRPGAVILMNIPMDETSPDHFASP